MSGEPNDSWTGPIWGTGHHPWATPLNALDVGSQMPERTFLGTSVADGTGLIYDRQINSLFGPSGAGKSLVAAAGIVGALWANFMVIDYEADWGTWRRRLDAMRLSRDCSQVAHVRPQGPLATDRSAMYKLMAYLGRVPEGDEGLIIIDSVGKAMATEGFSESDPRDVMSWMTALPSALTSLGWTVLLIDHQGKARSDSPVESFRKISEITGAAHRIVPKVPFTPSKPGYADLICKKDRHGAFVEGQKVAELVVHPKLGLHPNLLLYRGCAGPEVVRSAGVKIGVPGTWAKVGAPGGLNSAPQCDLTGLAYEVLCDSPAALSKAAWKSAMVGVDKVKAQEAIVELLNGQVPDRAVECRRTKQGRTYADLCWPSNQPEKAPVPQ